MFEHYEEKAWELSLIMKRISPFLFMRKFGLCANAANKLCAKIWLRQHLEARKLAKEIDNG